MNKRIQKLAKQAGFGLRRDGEIYTSRLEHLPITEDLAKFAESIVRECIQAIQNESKDPMDELEYGLRVAEGAILDHFGVKE